MRLRIFVNRSDPAFMHDYAVLSLNIKEQMWSREVHRGIDIPRTGKLQEREGGITLYGFDGRSALCRLQGLCFDRDRRVNASEGTVAWLPSRLSVSTEGRWYLREVVRPLSVETDARVGI